MSSSGVRQGAQNRSKDYDADRYVPSAAAPIPGHLALHLFVYPDHTVACINRVNQLPYTPGFRRFGTTRIPVGTDTLAGKPLDVVIALICEALLVSRLDRLRGAVSRPKAPAPPEGVTGAAVQVRGQAVLPGL